MASHTRESWIDGAYRRFNDTGLASVRVETVARDIGATKGSFYWHFGNRSDLIAAVMQRWERSETEDVIDLVESGEGTPEQRLTTLFERVGSRMRDRGGERTLYTQAEAEGVLDVVTRVIDRRMAYVTGILQELGFENAEVRAAVAIAAVIGLQQLITGGWESMPGDEIVDTLLRQALAR